MSYLKESAERLKKTRPTAVNLFHAIERCLSIAYTGDTQERVDKILVEADAIAAEDLAASKEIGRIGAELIKDGYRILTHCNAGALAFIDEGTALSPIRQAHSQGKRVFVWVDETRPRCQGSRLTAWEMDQEGIPYAIIVDNAAGLFMRRKMVDMVIVGADRIAANGDVANKIGTYEKAVLAKENGVPFYVAAPKMTFDLESKSGEEIEIENRDPEEVTMMWGVDEKGNPTRIKIAKEGSEAKNPSFDITPAIYVNGFITEKGLLEPPFEESFSKLFSGINDQ
jgi:S-methyl-5-thioribose-1-phosphate isomerase